MSAIAPKHPTRYTWPHLAWAGMLASMWALAGGLAVGLIMAVILLSERLHPGGFPSLTALLAVAGSSLGVVHGAVLGHIGRPDGLPKPTWLERILGVLVAVASVLVAVLGALWLALSAAMAAEGSAMGWVAVAIGGPASLAILAGATVLGWRALEHAYARWPEHGLGVWLVLGSFAVLTTVFLALRPAIPGTEMQPSTAGLVVLAALATIWVAAPAIVVMLRIRTKHHWLERRATY